MRVNPISPPQDAVDAGVLGGHWYEVKGSGARAILRWLGGPGSPDKDVILYDVEAEIPGGGAGSIVVASIGAWADKEAITLSCLAPPERVPWLKRLGFVEVEQRYGDVVCARSPKPQLY
jgi:hypothetical protein